MSNDVLNIITIKGKHEEILELLDFVKGEKSEFDYGKILPVPERGNSDSWRDAMWERQSPPKEVFMSLGKKTCSLSFYTSYSPCSDKILFALSKKFPTLSMTFKVKGNW